MVGAFYRQIQVILTILGLYDGKCNGVWGPKSIEAMKKWERLDSFEPAVPYNGRPFVGKGRLPKGFQYGPNLTIISELLCTDQALELLKTPLLTSEDVAEQCAGVARQGVTEQKTEAYVHPAPPAVTPPVIITEIDSTVQDPVDDEEEKPVEQQPAQKTVQQGQPNKNVHYNKYKK